MVLLPIINVGISLHEPDFELMNFKEICMYVVMLTCAKLVSSLYIMLNPFQNTCKYRVLYLNLIYLLMQSMNSCNTADFKIQK